MAWESGRQPPRNRAGAGATGYEETAARLREPYAQWNEP